MRKKHPNKRRNIAAVLIILLAATATTQEVTQKQTILNSLNHSLQKIGENTLTLTTLEGCYSVSVDIDDQGHHLLIEEHNKTDCIGNGINQYKLRADKPINLAGEMCICKEGKYILNSKIHTFSDQTQVIDLKLEKSTTTTTKSYLGTKGEGGSDSLIYGAGLILLLVAGFLIYRRYTRGRELEDNQRKREKMVDWIEKELRNGEDPEKLKTVVRSQGFEEELVDYVEKKMM